jgi:glutathione synthase/RimK-type ligase-like ATP-grasp enzyme
MKNKTYRSKITPIFIDIANQNGYKYVISETDNDAGYIIYRNSRLYFTYGTLDLNTDAAVGFAKSKPLSSEVVKNIGIRLPNEETVKYSSKTPSHEYLSEAKKVISLIGLPCFLKPAHGTQGRNIFKVESFEDLEFAIKNIIADKDDLLIQEYINADEVRIVLLDGEILQAYTRDYVSITGDGVKTIQELIKNKNDYFASRNRNTIINVNDSQILNILKNKKYNFNHVLSQGEQLNLSYGRNLSRGGNYEFVDKKLSTELVNMSKQIAKSTGLRLVGLDLFLSDKVECIKSMDQITFIEYNASPDMENNFYYDGEYTQTLYGIYEKIFKSMVK